MQMAHRWYVVHAYSGSEKAVADEIRRKAEKQGLTDRFEDILIPTEEVMEIKRGQKQQVERKVFPGLYPGSYGFE
jgi:transcriptional antiterminator NusG